MEDLKEEEAKSTITPPDQNNKNNTPTLEIEQPKPEPPKMNLISIYELNYTRKGKELNEVSKEMNLPRTEKCKFMLIFKLISPDSENELNPEEEKEIDLSKANLSIACHEVGALYFDAIYEKIYTFSSLCEENKYFRLFDSNEEVKKVIDEILSKNKNNHQKFFIDFTENSILIHLKIIMFNKEKEIVFSIPKKKLNTKQKAEILPKLLKEVYDKIKRLQEENKKLREENSKIKSRNSGMGGGYGGFEDEYINSDIYERRPVNEKDLNELKDNLSGKEGENSERRKKIKKEKKQPQTQSFF